MDGFEVTYSPSPEETEKAIKLMRGKGEAVAHWVRYAIAVAVGLVFLLSFIKDKNAVLIVLAAAAFLLAAAELLSYAPFVKGRIANYCADGDITVSVKDKEFYFQKGGQSYSYPVKSFKKILRKDGLYVFDIGKESLYWYMPEVKIENTEEFDGFLSANNRKFKAE